MFSEIRLTDLFPNVFLASGKEIQTSDIWHNDVVFRKKERYLIEAASGTGKTSLCSYINGMRNDFQGKICFDNQDSGAFSKRKWSEIRRLSLAWLPQEIGLFDNLTLLENLWIKNRLTRHLNESVLEGYIDKLGLTDKKNTKAKFLSIGQQQRVGFIRMLCQPADFFLLDEPVSHLDNDNNGRLSEIMEDVLRATGAGLIVTSVGNRMAIDNLHELKL